ncbi:unnamed protein product [Plutella xylostella]|uniref:(diamondback moth) hypothetical protein n=1 Tax=Plutella xylostella TaxID=51655 RepID=A0A8S4FJ54_PLUXY|nr:unnamed protein product [Plutella xylostella]
MSFFIVFSCIVIILIVVSVYQKLTNAYCKSKVSLKGKTAIVTGGTAGMGLEIAKDFARRGARVIIVCPFEHEGENAREEIVRETKNENIVFQHLDLGSLKSVRKFANNVLKTEERLDILMNNAGVGIPADILTDDGLHLIMQINYFGHFLLTILLLPLLKKTGQSRVINTASVLHYVGTFDKQRWNSTGQYLIRVYGNSKYCLIPFSRELTRRLKGTGVVVNCVDPGAVGTRIFDSIRVPLIGIIARVGFYYAFKTAVEGAQTAIYASVDEAAGSVSGEYFKNCRQTRGVSSAYDDALASAVWKESVKCVQLSDEEYRKSF